MIGEYWAIILGLAILVILIAALGANLVLGTLKRRRARRQTGEN